MYVLGRCKKCNHVNIFNLGNLSVEQAQKWAKTTDMGECPGYHVEIGTWADYYDFDWDKQYSTEEEAKENYHVGERNK